MVKKNIDFQYIKWHTLLRINEGIESSLSPVEKSFADRLSAEVAQLKDLIAQNEQQTKNDAQLLKQEKQLRFIAEQCYQETQIKNEQLLQVRFHIFSPNFFA